MVMTLAIFSNNSVMLFEVHIEAILTHLCLVSHKSDFGKQCRPRSDTLECDVCSGSTLFALNTEISIKHGNNKN